MVLDDEEIVRVEADPAPRLGVELEDALKLEVNKNNSIKWFQIHLFKVDLHKRIGCRRGRKEV